MTALHLLLVVAPVGLPSVPVLAGAAMSGEEVAIVILVGSLSLVFVLALGRYLKLL